MTQLAFDTDPRTGLVLAIDIGTKLGFAVGISPEGGQQKLLESGMREFDHANHPGRRWLRLWQHLDALLGQHGPFGMVVCEDFVGGLRKGPTGQPITTRAPIVYGSFRAIIEVWSCHHGFPMRFVNPVHLKRAATGSGAAKKPAMVAAASRRWGFRVVDDNHADALCLLAGWFDGTVEGTK